MIEPNPDYYWSKGGQFLTMDGPFPLAAVAGDLAAILAEMVEAGIPPEHPARLHTETVMDRLEAMSTEHQTMAKAGADFWYRWARHMENGGGGNLHALANTFVPTPSPRYQTPDPTE